MLEAKRIATVHNRPLYRDCNGDLCIEVDGQYLRPLTKEEEIELSKQLKDSGGDR